eukprot:SM000023S07579  [mRNA]  locus=s23:256954:262008:- [translate_table: standard]
MMGGGGGAMDEAAPGPARPQQLHDVLAGLCRSSGWAYAVFWRLRPRAMPHEHACGRQDGTAEDLKWASGRTIKSWPKQRSAARPCLTALRAAPAMSPPQDLGSVGSGQSQWCPTSGAGLDGFYSLNNWRLSPKEFSTVNPARLSEEFGRMSYQLYNCNDGLIGKVAAHGSYQWVHKKDLEHAAASDNGLDGLSEQYPAGWQEQFDAGIQTIAGISVAQGVLQLGSCCMLPPNSSLVQHVRDLFQAFNNVQEHTLVRTGLSPKQQPRGQLTTQMQPGQRHWDLASGGRAPGDANAGFLGAAGESQVRGTQLIALSIDHGNWDGLHSSSQGQPGAAMAGTVHVKEEPGTKASKVKSVKKATLESLRNVAQRLIGQKRPGQKGGAAAVSARSGKPLQQCQQAMPAAGDAEPAATVDAELHAELTRVASRSRSGSSPPRQRGSRGARRSTSLDLTDSAEARMSAQLLQAGLHGSSAAAAGNGSSFANGALLGGQPQGGGGGAARDSQDFLGDLLSPSMRKLSLASDKRRRSSFDTAQLPRMPQLETFDLPQSSAVSYPTHMAPAVHMPMPMMVPPHTTAMAHCQLGLTCFYSDQSAAVQSHDAMVKVEDGSMQQPKLKPIHPGLTLVEAYDLESPQSASPFPFHPSRLASAKPATLAKAVASTAPGHPSEATPPTEEDLSADCISELMLFSPPSLAHMSFSFTPAPLHSGPSIFSDSSSTTHLTPQQPTQPSSSFMFPPSAAVNSPVLEQDSRQGGGSSGSADAAFPQRSKSPGGSSSDSDQGGTPPRRPAQLVIPGGAAALGDEPLCLPPPACTEPVPRMQAAMLQEALLPSPASPLGGLSGFLDELSGGWPMPSPLPAGGALSPTQLGLMWQIQGFVTPSRQLVDGHMTSDDWSNLLQSSRAPAGGNVASLPAPVSEPLTSPTQFMSQAKKQEQQKVAPVEDGEKVLQSQVDQQQQMLPSFAAAPLPPPSAAELAGEGGENASGEDKSKLLVQKLRQASSVLQQQISQLRDHFPDGAEVGTDPKGQSRTQYIAEMPLSDLLERTLNHLRTNSHQAIQGTASMPAITWQ